MANITFFRKDYNRFDIPLFLWAAEQPTLPIMARRLCRAGLHPATARTICEVSGFGGAA